MFESSKGVFGSPHPSYQSDLMKFVPIPYIVLAAVGSSML